MGTVKECERISLNGVILSSKVKISRHLNALGTSIPDALQNSSSHFNESIGSDIVRNKTTMFKQHKSEGDYDIKDFQLLKVLGRGAYGKVA